MAEPLKKSAWQSLRFRVIILALGAAGASAGACAEALQDPTRPPALLTMPAQAVPATGSGLVLQSVLISPGRKVAVISGQAVQVGDKLGDARIVRIAEGEVQLATGKDLQTLKLFPGIEKRLANKDAAAKANIRR